MLNETLHNTRSLLQGQAMVQHLLNRTFKLPTGDVYIGPSGERTVTVLGDLYDPTTKTFVVCSISLDKRRYRDISLYRVRRDFWHKIRLRLSTCSAVQFYLVCLRIWENSSAFRKTWNFTSPIKTRVGLTELLSKSCLSNSCVTAICAHY